MLGLRRLKGACRCSLWVGSPPPKRKIHVCHRSEVDKVTFGLIGAALAFARARTDAEHNFGTSAIYGAFRQPPGVPDVGPDVQCAKTLRTCRWPELRCQ